MVKEVDVVELRKRLGIKKLKKKIPISDAEKEEILQLREHDKRRVTHAEKLKAWPRKTGCTMSIIDTSLLIDRIREGKDIDENVSMISVIEHPMIMDYARFHGRVLYPDLEDLEVALELQRKLVEKGKWKIRQT